jgi:hypothetical protein
MSSIVEGSGSKQSGFGVAQTLIVFVVVGAIAGIGWLVYQHSQPKVTGAASNTSGNTQQTTTPTPATTYFTIKEWRVRAPYSGALTLKYTISGNTAIFTSAELVNENSNCGSFGGRISRSGPSDIIDAAGDTATDFYAKNGGSDQVTILQLGNYYYLFRHDQSLCSALTLPQDSAAAGIQAQTNDAVKALVRNLQAVPN